MTATGARTGVFTGRCALTGGMIGIIRSPDARNATTSDEEPVWAKSRGSRHRLSGRVRAIGHRAARPAEKMPASAHVEATRLCRPVSYAVGSPFTHYARPVLGVIGQIRSNQS